MDGNGNDFIIIDGRSVSIALKENDIIALADRKNKDTGGCDQLVIIEKSADADCFMRIYNADGSEVSACGNATRCVGSLILNEKNAAFVNIQTNAGILHVFRSINGDITVDMGEPKLGWRDIPLSEEMDTLHLNISEGVLSDPVAISMGNPHAVFFVDNIRSINLEKLGPKLEHHKLFPQRANIGIAHVNSSKDIELRVWERGAGETKSCGTGACAALVAATRRGFLNRVATIITIGGKLEINWLENNHVLMTGSVNRQFEGITEL